MIFEEVSPMTSRQFVLPALLAIALGVSACASKKKTLPPPPPAAPVAPPSTGGSGNTGEAPPASVGNANVPGSAADFVAQSGSDRVLFTYDSYELDDTAKATLGKQAEWLARYPAVKVTVEGHCDPRGTREYNLALGDRRAQAAKNFLAGQGVATSRMTTISYGKERPAVEGTDEAAYAQDRRAVTVVVGAK